MTQQTKKEKKEKEKNKNPKHTQKNNKIKYILWTIIFQSIP